ncbi:MAG: FAD:protein FMN transferase [Fimbriiglobus sp.]|jgi:thiamine biosynthesis lipoprotein|nr:FAD:protein FMN transferase [Fimbriiglobus sp.]
MRPLVIHLILFATVAHAESLKRFEATSVHMGTEWKIVAYAADETQATAATDAAFQRVAELDAVMSDYNPKSELMKLCAANDAAPGKPLPVSDDLLKVLTLAQGVSAQTSGAFDCTVGPVVKLWRTARKTKQLPTAEELKAARELVGSTLLTLDAKAKTATLAKAGMRLDLGGIGKGFAADEAMKVLKAKGVASALIAASGDITVSDAPPGKEAWVVDIAPLTKGGPRRTLKLVNASVSTSGDLFQHVEIGGVRYSHVLDPKTGVGLTGRRSATVIAPHGWQADALTKGASLLPAEQLVKLIDGIDGAAAFVAVKMSEDAKETVTKSKRFEQFTK